MTFAENVKWIACNNKGKMRWLLGLNVLSKKKEMDSFIIVSINLVVEFKLL